MVVDERFLQPNKSLVPHCPGLRIDIDDAEFTDARVIEVEGGSDAELEIGRLERGVPLDQRERHDLLLAEERLCVAAEGVVRARRHRCLRGDRRRDTRRLVKRIAYCSEIKKPVFAEDRFVSFEGIRVVRVEHIFATPEGVEDAPPIRNWDRDARRYRLWR